MNRIKHIGLSILALGCFISLSAKENVGEKRVAPVKSNNKLMKYAASCDPATASADLDVNNVRTKIQNGGDMWWDLSNPKYEIPKIADQNTVRKHSLFSGAIWVGGYDGVGQSGNLKLAAMTYRQTGSDFWPGPIDPVTGNTDGTVCKAYDNIYKVEQKEITDHYENVLNGTPTLTEGISSWPARTSLNSPSIAPFFDANNDGVYSPLFGDYPVLQNSCKGNLNLENKPEDQPDQMLFFVYNDKGNIHSESGATPIGLELHTTAFAFATNDEINNMTFYTTTIINRGFTNLYDTYFGEWVDADLGNYIDDYVGCDVHRSLGFCYNGDDNDDGILGYGLNPPSVGIDFFEGPKKDTTINGKDTTFELGMSKFVYYNNDFSNFGNPQLPIHFYYYLTGRWKNGNCMTCDGKSGQTGTNCTNYLFPFETDQNCAANWNERTAGNSPGDRRFLQTSGPFTLKPGAVNKLTVGVVWAKASSGGAEGSLNLLKLASDKAQSLFNNCFDIVDGPDAPDVKVQELDNELVFLFGDTKRIENYSASVKDENDIPQLYNFEGYRIYQLKDGTVGTGDLDDIDKAREVFACDVKNNVLRLVNKPFDPILGERVPKLMIDGTNEGLQHSISLTTDAFATGSNKTLVNFKTYYYLILSYASEPNSKQDQYLAGRRVKILNASPRNPQPRMGGSNTKGEYGLSPRITRMEGSGNGGNWIDLTTESELEIISNPPYKMAHPTYEVGKGPVKVAVVDPLMVPKGEFELVFLENPDSIASNPRLRRAGVKGHATDWILVRKYDNGLTDTVYSQSTIDKHNEQLITANSTRYYAKKVNDWGMAVTIDQVLDPGNADVDETNGSLGAEVIFTKQGTPWLTAITDIDGNPFYNWIHSGTNGKASNYTDPTEHDYALSGTPMDPFESYEKLWEGRIAPYRLASRFTNNAGARYNAQVIQGIAYDGTPMNSTWGMDNLSSVDLVITPDRTKWSKVNVLEMSDDNVLAQGSTKKFNPRERNSIDINGNEIPGERGRSWFPGYAINIETGERLNIIIGEDSRQYTNNGRDLKWNPTDDQGFYGSGILAHGGRHFIYIMGSYEGVGSQQPFLPNYDEGNAYFDIFKDITPATNDFTRGLAINKVMFQCMWVIPTILNRGFTMKEVDGMPVPDSEVRFKIRVKKPYRYFETITGSANNDNPRYTFKTDEVYNEISNETAKSALDIVNVVPNPYYAFSPYESSPVENKVKITNLPERCDISIYTVDGTLVKRIKKDDSSTEVVWDIKNDAKVPIASGIYLIHVNAPGVGEKVLKWMGIMRQLDLDSF
ncbi:MAG: hypothetical protein H6605_03265 [Flavobacteriales bacterium]|nr:hypothetical protein [Flavobacteriales bacterium]